MSNKKDALNKCLAYYSEREDEVFSKELFEKLIGEMMKVKVVDPRFEGKKLWDKLGEL